MHFHHWKPQTIVDIPLLWHHHEAMTIVHNIFTIYLRQMHLYKQESSMAQMSRAIGLQ